MIKVKKTPKNVTIRDETSRDVHAVPRSMPAELVMRSASKRDLSMLVADLGAEGGGVTRAEAEDNAYGTLEDAESGDWYLVRSDDEDPTGEPGKVWWLSQITGV